MANFETPALREYPIIPLLRADTMAHSKTFVAKAEYQTPLGFPGELVETGNRRRSTNSVTWFPSRARCKCSSTRA